MTNLDEAYNNGDFIPGADSYPARWSESARAFRDRQTGELDIAYGSGPRHRYDLFVPSSAPKGTLIFIHGGYWRRFDNKSWSHLGAGGIARGWAVAMPSYDLCPDVSIAMITQQMAAAVTAIARKHEGTLALAGHSAGGHLVARMMAPGMLHGDIVARIQHVMPISPLSDLLPLLQTSMNDDFQMDEAMAEAESPLNAPRPDTSATVWVGSEERPAFLDQAMWLSEHWGCEMVADPGKHHFDVIEALADPESAMIDRLLT